MSVSNIAYCMGSVPVTINIDERPPMGGWDRPLNKKFTDAGIIYDHTRRKPTGIVMMASISSRTDNPLSGF